MVAGQRLVKEQPVQQENAVAFDHLVQAVCDRLLQRITTGQPVAGCPEQVRRPTLLHDTGHRDVVPRDQCAPIGDKGAALDPTQPDVVAEQRGRAELQIGECISERSQRRRRTVLGRWVQVLDVPELDNLHRCRHPGQRQGDAFALGHRHGQAVGAHGHADRDRDLVKAGDVGDPGDAEPRKVRRDPMPGLLARSVLEISRCDPGLVHGTGDRLAVLVVE